VTQGRVEAGIHGIDGVINVECHMISHGVLGARLPKRRMERALWEMSRKYLRHGEATVAGLEGQSLVGRGGLLCGDLRDRLEGAEPVVCSDRHTHVCMRLETRTCRW
jgi:hypothetical protein